MRHTEREPVKRNKALKRKTQFPTMGHLYRQDASLWCFMDKIYDTHKVLIYCDAITKHLRPWAF